MVTTSRLHFSCRCGIVFSGGICAQTLNKIKIRHKKTGMKSQTIARYSYCILERICGGKVYKSRYQDIAYATMLFHRFIEKGFCESVSVILVESPHVLSDEQSYRLVLTWPNLESSVNVSLVKRGGII